MGTILFILQLIGAIPQIIDMVMKIWEMIKQIRDRRKKALMKVKLRQMVFRRQNIRKMSAEQAEEINTELKGLHDEVFAQLTMERVNK